MVTIEDNRQDFDKRRVMEIEIGDTFEADGVLFMKTDRVGAQSNSLRVCVKLADGQTILFNDQDMVLPVDITISIDDITTSIE